MGRKREWKENWIKGVLDKVTWSVHKYVNYYGHEGPSVQID